MNASQLLKVATKVFVNWDQVANGRPTGKWKGKWTSLQVARCLLKEIIPQFKIPMSIGSDNGPAFVAKVVELIAKGLGIT
jgi:hypothetical protein